MGWATGHITRLQSGETVSFRPRGGSMKGRVESGQLVTIAPVVDPGELRVDDIVLCQVRGAQYLHLIKAVSGERFLIGNNRGGTNGWVGARGIYGKCIAVVP